MILVLFLLGFYFDATECLIKKGDVIIQIKEDDAHANYKFPPGSMGPKVEAAMDFAKKTGKNATIGRLDEAVDILNGKAGTTISQAYKGMEFL